MQFRMVSTGAIAPMPGIMRRFWGISSRNPPEFAFRVASSIHRRDPSEVSHQFVDPVQQPRPQPAFVTQQRDRFGVLADMDQGRSEIRLPVGLPVVQPDERPAQQDRHERAQRCVAEGDAEEQRADRPEHAPERDGPPGSSSRK